jgi:hypothetical protein
MWLRCVLMRLCLACIGVRAAAAKEQQQQQQQQQLCTLECFPGKAWAAGADDECNQPAFIACSLTLRFLLYCVCLQEYARFTRIVFDTAPTGHTLRLLTLPDFVDASLTKVTAARMGMATAGVCTCWCMPGTSLLCCPCTSASVGFFSSSSSSFVKQHHLYGC